MAFVLGTLGGAMIGGILFASLFSWLLRRFAGMPLGGSFFFGWIGCCLLASWGMAGDGLPMAIMYLTNPRTNRSVVNGITTGKALFQGSSSLLRFAHHAYRYRPSVTL